MKKNIMVIITLGLMIANGLIFIRYKDPQSIEAPHANRSLLEVVRNGDMEKVQPLISADADVHEKNPESDLTPLHQAAATGSIETYAAEQENKEIERLLVAHGATSNQGIAT